MSYTRSLLVVVSILWHFSAVQIGFEQATYSVDESAGDVTVTVRILSGVVANDIIVSFDTAERSAEGTRTHVN